MALEEKFHVIISRIIRKMSSQLDIVCHNCMGGNDSIHDQSNYLKILAQKIEDWNLKLQQKHNRALLCAYIKYSSLKVLRYSPLFL